MFDKEDTGRKWKREGKLHKNRSCRTERCCASCIARSFNRRFNNIHNRRTVSDLHKNNNKRWHKSCCLWKRVSRCRFKPIYTKRSWRKVRDCEVVVASPSDFLTGKRTPLLFYCCLL